MRPRGCAHLELPFSPCLEYLELQNLLPKCLNLLPEPVWTNLSSHNITAINCTPSLVMAKGSYLQSPCVGLSCLPAFTQNKVFNIHSHCDINQYFIFLCCIFHCANIL